MVGMRELRRIRLEKKRGEFDVVEDRGGEGRRKKGN